MARHLLSHGLLEGTVFSSAFSKLENSFGSLLLILLVAFFAELGDVGF
jgi:hypothetical protein